MPRRRRRNGCREVRPRVGPSQVSGHLAQASRVAREDREERDRQQGAPRGRLQLQRDLLRERRVSV
eukprot:7559989-Heterocapsa_arctica.AAC.1